MSGRALGVAIALFAGSLWLVPQSVDGKRRGSTPWAKVKAPSKDKAASLGGYSRGCVAGAQALPLRGDNHIVMRPERRRNYGHPELISMIKSLAASMKAHGLGRLAVGDLGQARGGPAPSGHKSHQSGLDVDLWYLTPAAVNKARLPKRIRFSSLGALSLVKPDQSGVTADMDARIMSVLRRTASDGRVSRIFVHPRIKQALCKRKGKSSDWLRKIRPWWGHSSHFHVRLSCPASDTLCENQSELPPGDGCKDLDWWFDAKAQAERKKGRAEYRKNMGQGPQMPRQCEDVLRAPSKK